MVRGFLFFEECVAEMSSDKPFKTYEQQIELLKEKGLSIPNETYAVKVLKDLSYFALINGYKKAFKQDGLYENASFEDIVALFKFDEKLRGILLKYILIIERKIKSSLSYHFSQKYPKCQEDYLNVNNYSYECVKNRDSILRLVSTLNSIIKSKNYPYIKHYVNHHDSQIPLWVLINAVSFGKVSKIFALSQQGIQQKVANDFAGVTNAELKNMLELLTHFRNVCAHNERLYNYKTRISLKKSSVFCALNGPRNDNCSLFSVVICMKFLLDNIEFDEFITEVENIISLLALNSSVSTQDIVRDMGFPPEWEKIKNLDIKTITVKTTIS